MVVNFRALSFNAQTGEREDVPIDLQAAIDQTTARIQQNLPNFNGAFTTPTPEAGTSNVAPPPIRFPNQTRGGLIDAQLLEGNDFRRQGLENSIEDTVKEIDRALDDRDIERASFLLDSLRRDEDEIAPLQAARADGIPGNEFYELFEETTGVGPPAQRAGRDERVSRALSALNRQDDDFLESVGIETDPDKRQAAERETVEQEQKFHENIRAPFLDLPIFAEDADVDDLRLSGNWISGLTTEQDIASYVAFQFHPERTELKSGDIQRRILDDEDILQALVVNDPFGIFDEGRGLELRESRADIRDLRRFLSTYAGVIEDRVFELYRRAE